MKNLKWNRKLSILVLIMFVTVSFASFNTNLFIDGKGYVRVDKDIRITNIRLLETEYNGYENISSEYTNRTISTDVSLPRQASSVTYEVTISNVSDRRYKITDIIEESYDNRNVKYELIDASIGNIVEPHTEKTFKVKFTNNVTVVEEDDVYETKTYNYDYTGEIQEFIAPFDGTYTLEVWGASGGGANNDTIGYGGYSTGKINLKENEKLYAYVGGVGGIQTIDPSASHSLILGGWNGGGSGYLSQKNGSNDFSAYKTGSGGGSTDIRKVKANVTFNNNSYYTNHRQSLESRIIVAGGGGGQGHNAKDPSAGGHAGGIAGNNVSSSWNDSHTHPAGGTQTTGTFGYGSTPVTGNTSTHLDAGQKDLYCSGGAGGGWYGGEASIYQNCRNFGGAGGSGYIGTSALFDKAMYCYNCQESTEESTKTISVDQVSENPESNKAKIGNGYAKITVTRKIEDGSAYNFDYTGGEQIFTAPYSGTYRLETWGASGGAFYNSGKGGYGGYSTGTIDLIKNNNLYINVGETGHTKGTGYSVTKRTYNGGGASGDVQGGGATHIALEPGLLTTFSNKTDKLLIVSGGGAGGERHQGGHGGGIIGTTGGYGYNNAILSPAYGGSQTSGGAGGVLQGTYLEQYGNGTSGQFGLGGNSCLTGVCGGGAGGGGYYGGGSTNYVGGGGGGSGYIGNNLLKDKKMYCYDCQESNDINTKTVTTLSHSKMPKQNIAKEGNGFSRITLLKRTINQTKLTLDFTFEEYVNGNEYTFGFTGEPQEFVVPKTGYYKVELWGARGGYANGSYGAYTSGKVKLNAGEKLYIYVGEKKVGTVNVTSFNGGTSSADGQPGGGATDVRLVSGEWNDDNSLNSRIMVAAGGGAYAGVSPNLGYGGGLQGGVSYSESAYNNNDISTPATQTVAGIPTNACGLTYPSGFGVGGSCAGGGGGYYGGAGTAGLAGGGSGGSSFISGHNGCVAITSESDRTPRNDSNGNQCADGTTDITCSKHYSNYLFTDTVMIDGAGYSWTTERSTEYSGMPTTDGASIMTGNTDNGFAKITLVETIPEYTFDYTGDVQEFVAPYKGIYKVELWGAQGGNSDRDDKNFGSYTSGLIELNKNKKLYLYVGSSGSTSNFENNASCEFNGGGTATKYSTRETYHQGTGGGATDVRLVNGNWDNFDSLKSRIMVSSAGGGSFDIGGSYRAYGAPGGGFLGYQGELIDSSQTLWGESGTGGTQLAGGYAQCLREGEGCDSWTGYSHGVHYGIGGFGYGGNPPQIGSAGGGSGYFGGGSSMHSQSGGSGSSYISGHTGCISINENSSSDNISFINDSSGVACNDENSTGYNSLGYNTDSACSKHFSGKVFTDTVMIDGAGYSWDENGKGDSIVGMPSHDGRTTMTGNTGNGYAKITLIEKIDTYSINYDLDGGTLKNKKKTYSTFDSDISLGTPTKEKYKFIGWTGGKNLIIQRTNTWYDGTNKVFYTGNENANSVIAKVKPNTTYTVSRKNPGNRFVVLTSKTMPDAGVKVNRSFIFNEDRITTYTFTTTDDEKYVLFGFYRADDSFGDLASAEEGIQIEEGSVATTYEEPILTPTMNISIQKGSEGNRTYTANWKEYVSVTIIYDACIEDRDNNRRYLDYIDTVDFIEYEYLPSLTTQEYLARNSDYYMYIGDVWGITNGLTILNELFEAGANIVTTGNDTTAQRVPFGVTDYHSTEDETITKKVSNEFTSQFKDSYSTGTDSKHFFTTSNTEVWYSVTVDDIEYDYMGRYTGAKGNKWIWSSGVFFPEYAMFPAVLRYDKYGN